MDDFDYSDDEPEHREWPSPVELLSNARSILDNADEAVMRDAEGKPTTSLMEAKGWLKDNRLLPQGYRFDHSEAPYTNPVGVNGDESFVAGGDITHYALLLPANS